MTKSDMVASIKGKTTLNEILNINGVKKLFSLFGDDMRCVGGCVRDALASQYMGKESHITANPEGLDVDLATVRTPEEVQKVLRANGVNVLTNANGFDHGTVFADIDNNIYEITSLRKEISYNGHDAEVEFITDWDEDAARRDFTVNAIYADKNGNIFDKFGGQKDLSIGAVRFIGNADERVKQDPVRIIRFFRACAELGAFPMGDVEIADARERAKQSGNDYMVDALDDHKKAIDACEANVASIDNLTSNRIALEVYKLMGTKSPVDVLKKMTDIGAMDYIFNRDVGSDDNGRPGFNLNFDVLSKMIDIEDRAGVRASKLCRITAMTDNTNRDEIYGILRINKQRRKILSDSYHGTFDIGGGEFNANWLLYKHGPEKALDLTLLSSAMGNIDDKHVFDLADKLENWEPHNFPLSGGMLKEECGINGSQISKMQKHLEQLWCASDFKLSKKELLDVVWANGKN